MSTEDLKISKEVEELAKVLEDRFNVEDDGAVKPSKELYEELLPETITMDQVKGVQKHHTDLVSATALAFGNVARDHLKKNPKVEEVHLDKFQFGKDNLRMNMKREAEVRNGPDGTVTRHGWMTAKYTSVSAGTGGAAFKRIRKHHYEEAEKLFG